MTRKTFVLTFVAELQKVYVAILFAVLNVVSSLTLDFLIPSPAITTPETGELGPRQILLLDHQLFVEVHKAILTQQLSALSNWMNGPPNHPVVWEVACCFYLHGDGGDTCHLLPNSFRILENQ